MSADTAYPDWASLQARHIAERRARAVRAARAAAAAAAPFGVRVIVFGSLATGGFHRRSDLDLALEGPVPAMERATGPVFGAAADKGFEPDIVRLDLASPRLVERIGETGRDATSLE